MDQCVSHYVFLSYLTHVSILTLFIIDILVCISKEYCFDLVSFLWGHAIHLGIILDEMLQRYIHAPTDLSVNIKKYQQIKGCHICFLNVHHIKIVGQQVFLIGQLPLPILTVINYSLSILYMIFLFYLHHVNQA